MNSQEYNLNIRPGVGIPPIVRVSQNDAGRPLAFKVYDGASALTIASGTTIEIHGTKRSGLGFTEACTWSGSTVSVDTTEAMTQESGAIPTELVFTSGTDVIASANFTLVIESSPHSAAVTDGTTEEARTVLAQCEEYAQAAQDAAEAAEDVVQGAVNEWLEEHPEATTTVQDGAITTLKIQDGAVTDDKTAEEYRNLFYDEVTVTKGRTSNTDYYIAEVPKYDDNNELIPLKLTYNRNLNPLEQAWENNSTVTINGYSSIAVNDVFHTGISICSGTTTNNYSFEGIAHDCALYLGVKDDRTIIEYKMNSSITADEMLADGCINVFNCYFKLVENGEIVSGLANGELYLGDSQATEDMRNPLMLLGLKNDGTILFMACDGRTSINDGLTYREAGELLISLGCTTVYNMDGGGSTCLVVKGSKVNRDIDDSGTSIRNIRYALHVIKSSNNTPTHEVYDKIGYEKQKLIEQIIPYINYVNDSSLAKIGTTIEANTDLNTLLNEGKYQCPNATVGATLLNSPVSTGFSLYCLHQGGGTAITQILIKNPNSSTGVQKLYYRSLVPSGDSVTAYEWFQFSPDTSSFDLTASTGVTVGRKTCTLNGKTVCVSVTFTIESDMATQSTLFTLPTTLKPTSFIDFIALKDDLSSNLLQVKTDGTIAVGAFAILTAGTYKANVTWNIA